MKKSISLDELEIDKDGGFSLLENTHLSSVQDQNQTQGRGSNNNTCNNSSNCNSWNNTCTNQTTCDGTNWTRCKNPDPPRSVL